MGVDQQRGGAVFRVRAPGDITVKQLVEQADIQLVPIEQAPALHLRKSSINPGRIPKGSYRGDPPLPERDLPTANVNRLLVADADLSPQTIYAIASVLFERQRESAERGEHDAAHCRDALADVLKRPPPDT